MVNPKFEQAKNKIILQAEQKAMTYLSSKYGISKLAKESTVNLNAVEGTVPNTFDFSGSITCFADNGMHQVEVGMTINTNDIEVESTNLQENIENSLNRAQENNLQDTTVHASLDAFTLTDDGTPYLKVSHADLNGADLGIVGKNEYAKSPDKAALLKSILSDKLTRTASESTTLVFTGEFKEPIIAFVSDEQEKYNPYDRQPSKEADLDVEARFYPCKYCADGHHTLCTGDPTCECPSKKCEEYINKVRSKAKTASACDQCASATINGKFCHETGCPKAPKKCRHGKMSDVCNVCSDPLESDPGFIEEASKKSWLTADLVEGYEGWTNQPTWEMALVIDNDEAILNDVLAHALDKNSLMEWLHERFAEQVTEDVNWSELADHFMEKAQDMERNSSVSIKENMPRATQSNKLTQDIQLEAQTLSASQDKVKNQAVNALVSMLQNMGYGSAKVAEVSVSKEGFDIMTTLDDAGTTKAVSIPVAIKESAVVLPKKSLVSTLISKGLDIRARLSVDFNNEILSKISAIENTLAYEANEVVAILTEKPEVAKEASDSSNEQFMGDTDVLTVQKHLLPNSEDLKEGDVISDGANEWEIFDTEAQQNDKNKGSSSEWKLRKKPTPHEDNKKSKERMEI